MIKFKVFKLSNIQRHEEFACLVGTTLWQQDSIEILTPQLGLGSDHHSKFGVRCSILITVEPHGKVEVEFSKKKLLNIRSSKISFLCLLTLVLSRSQPDLWATSELIAAAASTEQVDLTGPAAALDYLGPT